MAENLLNKARSAVCMGGKPFVDGRCGLSPCFFLLSRFSVMTTETFHSESSQINYTWLSIPAAKKRISQHWISTQML